MERLTIEYWMISRDCEIKYFTCNLIYYDIYSWELIIAGISMKFQLILYFVEIWIKNDNLIVNI